MARIRIRYKEVNGLLTLHKPLTGREHMLQVSIDPKNNEAVIFSISTAEPLSAIKAGSINGLKQKVKRELTVFGVTFSPEVRPGRNLNKGV